MLCSFSYEAPAVKEKLVDTAPSKIVFAVFDRDSAERLEGVKLVIIDRDGAVLSVLTTNNKGEAEKYIITNDKFPLNIIYSRYRLFSIDIFMEHDLINSKANKEENVTARVDRGIL